MEEQTLRQILAWPKSELKLQVHTNLFNSVSPFFPLFSLQWVTPPSQPQPLLD